jgi:hypothetical protein
MPISRQASSPTDLPSSMDRQPETWKPPIATGNAGVAERLGDIERTRILVRLHADQRHHAEIVVCLQKAEQRRNVDAGVGLVDDGDVDADAFGPSTSRAAQSAAMP